MAAPLIVIDCMGDPGMHACREVVSIPVLELTHDMGALNAALTEKAAVTATATCCWRSPIRTM